MTSATDQTKQHIAVVQAFLRRVQRALEDRGLTHDASKLQSPEVEAFEVFTEKLRGCTYGSDEYRRFLAEMKPALDHHYENNSHHPEHYSDGVDGMDILDVVEMLCDWRAASMRHADGSLTKSIDMNEKRFNLSPQLASIFRNSVGFFASEPLVVGARCVVESMEGFGGVGTIVEMRHTDKGNLQYRVDLPCAGWSEPGWCWDYEVFEFDPKEVGFTMAFSPEGLVSEPREEDNHE